MIRSFETEPNTNRYHGINSSRIINPRSIFKVKKMQMTLKMKTEREAQEEKSNLTRDMFQTLGSPTNKYICNKIKNVVHDREHIFNRRFHTVTKTISEDSTAAHLSFNSTPVSFSTRRYNSEDRKVCFDRSFVKNQREKLSRLIQRREEQEQDYRKLSQKIKIKLTPKKLLVKVHQPPHIMDKSWHRDWTRCKTRAGEQRQARIRRKLKTSQMHRNHTQQLFVHKI